MGNWCGTIVNLQTAVMRVLRLRVRDSACCHLAVGYFAARAETSSHWEQQPRSAEGICRKDPSSKVTQAAIVTKCQDQAMGKGAWGGPYWPYCLLTDD